MTRARPPLRSTHLSGIPVPFDARLSGPSWLARLSDPNVALAYMFGVGGVQGVVVLALPHWSIESPGVVLGVAVGGSLIAPLVWLSRRRLQPWTRQLGLGIGTVATSVAVFGCGPQPSSMTAAYFYFFVALYAAAYFRPRAAIGHLALVGVLYALVLALHPTSAFPAQWIQTMSALGAVTAIVGGFAFYVRSSAAALADQALHDRLTGLPNRALFLYRLDDAMVPVKRRTPIAVLFLDLDDFKEVNDGLGHAAGDQLLSAAALRLAGVTGASNLLAHFSGDEFAVLMEAGPMPAAAENLAGQIVAAFAVPFEIGGVEMHVGISVGVGFGHPGRDSAAEVLRDADLAMYQAKQNGKGRWVTARPGMLDDALEHMTLVVDLRHALTKRQFEVFYQPIVRAGTGRPVGAEALLRWHHPERGLIPPDEFIGAAESIGLIAPLGAWVLSEACGQAQAWRRAGTTDDTFYISVNVSPRQLADSMLIEDVSRALEDTGLPPEALVLELTESTLMTDFTAVLARLRKLKALGVRLALDDYGTGYSSLSRLRRLPFDIVKIDKSFVDHVAEAPEGIALVQSILDVTTALGMTSIAEGVETHAQLRALKELGCDAIQGYLFARPAGRADTDRALRRLAESVPAEPTTRPAPRPVALARRRVNAGDGKPATDDSR